MDVTTSYWRSFAAFVENQRQRSRRRTARLLAHTLVARPTRKSGTSSPLAPNAPRRDARFTIH